MESKNEIREKINELNIKKKYLDNSQDKYSRDSANVSVEIAIYEAMLKRNKNSKILSQKILPYGFRLLMPFKSVLGAISISGGLLKALRLIWGDIQKFGIIKAAENAWSVIKSVRYQKLSEENEGCFQPEGLNVLNGPLITLIVPIYNTPERYFRECVDSVRRQSYGNWQLILVDDFSSDNRIREVISDYCDLDPRINRLFRNKNGSISAAINDGLSITVGDYFSVLDHDDTLDIKALAFVAKAAMENPDADYIYSDEDKLSEDGETYFGPFYKPDWSPEYMLSMMYTCHMSVFKTNWATELGGYRSDFDGAQDYDFTLRVLARTNNVVHIPKVLYHWRAWTNSTAQSIDAKPYAIERQRRALSEYLQSMDDKFSIVDGPLPGHHEIRFYPKRDSLVSIVIPTANGVIDTPEGPERHIDAIVKSIRETTSYPNYEIVIVHNGDLNRDQEADFIAEPNIKLLQYTSTTFNLAEKINQGCEVASGEYLVIMNDDIRVITPDWLQRMLGMMQRTGVGVVGAKLLFPNRTIQHAGVVMLGGLPGHTFYEEPEDTHGYGLAAMVDRNTIAVTGACQMTSKYLFNEVGGYSTRYGLNYNDVDFCLKLREKGYRTVCMANVKMFHFEGVSKDGGRSVADEEKQMFLDDWSKQYPLDPYYNPNFSQKRPFAFDG